MKVICNKRFAFFVFAVFSMSFGCGDSPFSRIDSQSDAMAADAGVDSSRDEDAGRALAPSEYLFESRFDGNRNGVNHAGQSTRQVLIRDLIHVMRELSDGVLSGDIAVARVDEEGEVIALLDGILRGGSAALGTRALPILVGEGETLCQTTYQDLGDANLIAKIAGEDDITDYVDWDGDDKESSEPAFVGGPKNLSPVGYVDSIISTFESAVRACALDPEGCPKSPSGDDLPLYVTAEGVDQSQLLEKFLLGAINFSQAADDYLDDAQDDEGKGILADNTEPRSAGAESTTLEHAWDEAFGYFGAAANYGDYTDDEIRGAGGRPAFSQGFNDADANACIDVYSELNFSAAVNAAKRDAGSTTGTDYSQEAFDAFVQGRWLIASSPGVLSGVDLDALRVYRDAAIATWEKAIAATAVHYINEVRADMAACTSDTYSFADHAKHWAELKGFALSFQFNPRSPFAGPSDDFGLLHTQLGDGPVLCDGNLVEYNTTLLDVRAMLQSKFDFDTNDVEGW